MEINNLINEYSTYIYNYALKLSCHPQTAEDIAQETFIQAWKHIDALKNLQSIKPWLRKICYNTFLMDIRKNKKYSLNITDEIESIEIDGNKYYSSPLPAPEDEIIVDESIRELQNGCFLAMVRKLTLNQRIAFSLCDMFGLSINEVSKILDISQGAVKGLLYRAHMNLDSFFSSHCNIINVNNPCSCKAWINFSQEKTARQSQLIEILDYRKNNYKFDETVRKKVNFLYKNMPEQKPSQEWYINVEKIITEMYSK